MGRNVLKSSIENASFSIVFQILFRIITFLLNAFIIRHVGQTVLGIMNVRLLLLESTILYLSKEPILKACLTDTKSHNWAQVINQIWLTVPFTACVAVIFVYIWTDVLRKTDDVYLTQYYYGCYAIAISCIFDQMSQCLVIVAQSYCFVRLKVIIDTAYIIIRTVVFVVLVLKYPNFAINAFSIAQIVSSLAFCSSYYAFFYWYIKKLNQFKAECSGNESDSDGSDVLKVLRDENPAVQNKLFEDMLDFPFTSILDFFPKFMKNREKPLNLNLCLLAVSFFKQSIVKQILTEGEKYVMTISPVLTFSQQSMYDIVNNLGSLAARFLFRPLEESAYFYFTQMVKRDEEISAQDKKNIVEATTVLNQLCKVVTSIGLVVVVFGQSYSYALLYLYGGESLTSDYLPITLLRTHCFSVLLLAVNGITECYVFATMNNEQLDSYNYKMVIFSIVFLILSYVFTIIFGPVGFILANCVNMTARIFHSIYFIRKKFENTVYEPLAGLIPDLLFIRILFTSGIMTILSEIYLENESILLHLSVGAICFGFTTLAWIHDNKDLVAIGIEKFRASKEA